MAKMCFGSLNILKFQMKLIFPFGWNFTKCILIFNILNLNTKKGEVIEIFMYKVDYFILISETNTKRKNRIAHVLEMHFSVSMIKTVAFQIKGKSKFHLELLTSLSGECRNWNLREKAQREIWTCRM